MWTVIIILVVLFFIFSGGKTLSKANEENKLKNLSFIKEKMKSLSPENQALVFTYFEKGYNGDTVTDDDKKQMVQLFEQLNEEQKKCVNELFAYLSDDLLSPDKPIVGEDNPLFMDDIILTKNEKVYFESVLSKSFSIEKVVSKTVNYGGITSKSGPLKLGTVNYSVTPHSKMQHVCNGNILLTNKRILINGKKNDTKVVQEINLSSVLSYEVLKDSIIFYMRDGKQRMITNIEPDYKKMYEVGRILFEPIHIILALSLRKMENQDVLS